MVIPDDLRTWYYFGCWNGLGHHLYNKDGRSVLLDALSNLDGELCPKSRTGYHAQLTRLPLLGYSALAWWDYTVDTRPGSNSIIFAPSISCSTDSIIAGMRRWFTRVENRLPTPLVVLEGEHVYNPKRR